MEDGGYVVAIDLGTSAVKTVVGTRGGEDKVRIIDCACSQTPKQSIIRGEIRNIEQVAQSIQQIVEEIQARQPIKIREAYVGVSGQHIYLVQHSSSRNIGGEVRKEDVQGLRQDIDNVATPGGEQTIQMTPQSYIVDGEETMNPVGTIGSKLVGLFNFVRGNSQIISRVGRVLQRVQIRQAGLFLNATASAEAVATKEEKEEGVAVVDIGGGNTDVVVFYKGTIRHVGIMSIGGHAINRDIRSYGILERDIENLKVGYGSAKRDEVKSSASIKTHGLRPGEYKQISLRNLAGIVEARMLDMVDFVMEGIQASGCQEKLGGGIVLTGGAAQMKNLDLLFKSHTGFDVRIATPDAVIEPGSIEAASNPTWATAVGLLWMGLSQTPRGSSSPSRPPIDRESYSSDDEAPEDSIPSKTKGKGGLLKRVKQKIEEMFETIEDEPIDDNQV